MPPTTTDVLVPPLGAEVWVALALADVVKPMVVVTEGMTGAVATADTDETPTIGAIEEVGVTGVLVESGTEEDDEIKIEVDVEDELVLELVLELEELVMVLLLVELVVGVFGTTAVVCDVAVVGAAVVLGDGWAARLEVVGTAATAEDVVGKRASEVDVSPPPGP